MGDRLKHILQRIEAIGHNLTSVVIDQNDGNGSHALTPLSLDLSQKPIQLASKSMIGAANTGSHLLRFRFRVE